MLIQTLYSMDVHSVAFSHVSDLQRVGLEFRPTTVTLHQFSLSRTALAFFHFFVSFFWLLLAFALLLVNVLVLSHSTVIY